MKKEINRRKFIKASLSLGGATLIAKSSIGKGVGFFASNPKTSGYTTQKMFDTIISNGIIYSGEIKQPVKGDIGIKNGRIAAIGDLGNSCDNFVDAKGNAISPGFIDIHSHTDTNLFEAPLGNSKIFQGITTDVGGNCGSSPFPLSDAEYESVKNSLRFGYPNWKDADGFFDSLSKNKIGINYMSYIGHSIINFTQNGKAMSFGLTQL